MSTSNALRIVYIGCLFTGAICSAFAVRVLVHSAQRGRPPLHLLSSAIALGTALALAYASADALRTGKMKLRVLMIVPALAVIGLLIDQIAG